MTEPTARPIPLLGDIPLTAVQFVEQSLDAGFHDVPVIGLAGHVQQRGGRSSHRIGILGVLTGEHALDDLAALQGLAASGAETTFAADIVSALDLQQVVVTSFRATEVAGRPGVVDFSLELAESPPLPPPAQLAGFGGLDDFGLGDLGFDTDILGDLQDAAGDIAGAVDDALDAVGALEALAGLAEFDFGGILAPVDDITTRVGQLGEQLGAASGALGEVFGA